MPAKPAPMTIAAKSGAMAAADEINAVPGAIPRENTVGTNSLGTTLHLRSTVGICGWQHYCEAFWQWSDVGAPLIHPTTGEVLGVLDLGLSKEILTPALILAAKAMAGRIQAALLEQDAALARAASWVRRTASIPKPASRSADQQPRFAFEQIIGRSPDLIAARTLAERAARTDLPILVCGETGTGKELFAHAIHAASARSSGPFVAVNCGAIPTELIASELFGYAKGAFTGANSAGMRGKFEQADGGTLFLDEITETGTAF